MKWFSLFFCSFDAELKRNFFFIFVSHSFHILNETKFVLLFYRLGVRWALVRVRSIYSHETQIKQQQQWQHQQ